MAIFSMAFDFMMYGKQIKTTQFLIAHLVLKLINVGGKGGYIKVTAL